MFIDTHAHISKNYGIDPDMYINNAKEVGVNYIIVSCCDKKSIVDGLEFIKKYDNIFLTIGFHPDEIDNVSDEDINDLERVIKENRERIVGIGEIGLDYHFVKDRHSDQIKLFRRQLELAVKLKLPVVIHSRDAIQETYDILSEYKLKGDIHCFSGSVEMAKKFIDLGFYIGIGGVVTFSNSKLYQVVESIGINNIVLETDSPYLSPFRGQINESKNIPVVASNVANILNEPISNIANITTDNAVKLFDLNI